MAARPAHADLETQLPGATRQPTPHNYNPPASTPETPNKAHPHHANLVKLKPRFSWGRAPTGSETYAKHVTN